MRRGFVIGMGLWLCALGIQAQSGLRLSMDKEGKIVALPTHKDYSWEIPKESHQTVTPAGTTDLDARLREFKPEVESLDLWERPMDMQISSTAYQPFFNVYTPMLRRVSPMAMDFYESYGKPLNDSFGLVSRGVQYSWPGVGGMTFLNAGAVWHKDRWTIEGTGVAGRFYTPINPHPAVAVGIQGQVGYEVSDWLRLRTFGQYIHTNKAGKSTFLDMNPFLYKTEVGGALDFKIRDDFRFGIELKYQRSPFSNRWDRQLWFVP